MFEHLDDPQPFHADDDFRRGVFRRGERLRLRRRIAAVATGLAVTVVGVGAAGALYVDRRDAAIDRVEVESPSSVDGATNILLVGTDARPADGSPADATVTGSRSDTMVIVRLQADGSVGVLPIPRDLQDPTTGQRVNGAHNDGAQALVDTIVSVTGLPVDHYVELDFAGLVALVDELGGVRLAVDRSFVDTSSGLLLDPSPCATLDGETALALARARHVEGDDSGDFGRMARGQAALTALIAELSDAEGDPRTVDRLTRVLADHAAVDDGLTLRRMADLAHGLAAAGPERVVATSLPVVEVQTDEGASVLALAPEAAPVLQAYGAPDDFVVPTPPPSGTGGGGGQTGGVVELPTGDPGIGPCPPGSG
jgi:LCP family protein required for cell wall assembly